MRPNMTIAELDRLEAMRLSAVQECVRIGDLQPSWSIDGRFPMTAEYLVALQAKGAILIRQARQQIEQNGENQ